MMEEIWKDIPGYEGVYAISNTGRVLSHNMRQHTRVQVREKVQATIEGYKAVKLWGSDGSTHTYCIHKLVAQLFVPNDDPVYKRNVRHKDGDRDNNCADNLEWYHAAHPMSEETRKKVLAATKGIPKWYENGRNRAVKVFDYKTGEMLGVFKSIAEARRHYKIPDVGHLRNNLTKQSGGYRLEYVKKKPRYY